MMSDVSELKVKVRITNPDNVPKSLQLSDVSEKDAVLFPPRGLQVRNVKTADLPLIRASGLLYQIL